MKQEKTLKKNKYIAPKFTLGQLTKTILSNLVTEKTTRIGESGSVCLVVAPSASKFEIKAAVEYLYEVKVASVQVVNIKGRSKYFRGVKGKLSGVRKAYVKLQDGQSVDLANI
ncbi:MAG: 50S ribosomal protein L23 [Gammaproteobacteria bacterium]|nr:50S ribosomal protein L23 [Gammaproteobacteria bacterium]